MILNFIENSIKFALFCLVVKTAIDMKIGEIAYKAIEQRFLRDKSFTASAVDIPTTKAKDVALTILPKAEEETPGAPNEIGTPLEAVKISESKIFEAPDHEIDIEIEKSSGIDTPLTGIFLEVSTRIRAISAKAKDVLGGMQIGSHILKPILGQVESMEEKATLDIADVSALKEPSKKADQFTHRSKIEDKLRHIQTIFCIKISNVLSNYFLEESLKNAYATSIKAYVSTLTL